MKETFDPSENRSPLHLRADYRAYRSGKFPEKKIFVATPVCGLSDVSDTASDYRENFAKTRSVITAHAKKHANAVLLDGHEILKKHYYLSADLLHPSDFGHVRMGHDFAALIEPWLREEIAARGKRS